MSSQTTVSPYTASDVTVAIPTYGRDEVLTNTIAACLNEPVPPATVIVIDQTPKHDDATELLLKTWHDSGKIIWVKPAIASQPAAMNVALQIAKTPLILFLDDDIEPAPGFVQTHAESFVSPEIWIVVGQIIQPWQTPTDITPPVETNSLISDFEFPFHTTQDALGIKNVMSGHMTVICKKALELGGFDENFKGAAYRFDTEFGRRVIKQGGLIRYQPRASIKHLRVARGGTRIHGGHLASASPIHGQGDYYYALLHGTSWQALKYCTYRLFREVRTKFHLTHPWYIPVKLLGEIRALLWAIQLKITGPKLIQQTQDTQRS